MHVCVVERECCWSEPEEEGPEERREGGWGVTGGRAVCGETGE